MSIARLIFLSLATMIGATFGAKASDWPVIRFDVCYGDPDNVFVGWLPGSCDGDPVLAEKIETYLAEVAVELQAQGFRPPTLGEPVQTADGPAYRVYVFAADDERPQAAYNNPCGGATPYIYLDIARTNGGALFSGSEITNKGFVDMAHELFHAIQASYDPFVSTCELGAWITEGTATAWGKDTALKLRGVSRDDQDRPTVKWDARGYDSELYVRSGAAGYDTGSFWRFLGEAYAARRAGGRATTTERTPNYRYLHVLFEQNLPGKPGASAEYAWLDVGLQKAFGRGLGSLYPQFVGNFAAFIPDREIVYRSRRERVLENAFWGRRRDRWLSYLFDSCPRLLFTEEAPQIYTEYHMDRVSSRCVLIRASPLRHVDLSVQFLSKGDVDLDHVAISIAGDGRSARGTVVDFPGGLSLGGVTVPLDLSKDQVLILSNVAPDAANTRRISLPVLFSVSTHSSNLQEEAQAPPPAPDAKRAAQEGEGTSTDPLKEAAADRATSGALVLSPNKMGGNVVTRDPEAAPCAEPFVFTACGPSTALQFTLRPAGMNDLDAVAGSGGQLSHFTTNSAGLTAVYGQAPGYNKQLRELLEATDGSEISIRIPLIDYGFTGSFSNARIVVTMADREGLEAVGPADVEPGPARRFPLSGTVTIEEYTPLLMRGSFSADLVQMGERGKAGDPVLPIARTLEGRFFISQPWRTDRRVQVRNAGIAMTEMVEEAFPGISLVPGAALSVTAPPARPETPGNGAASRTSGCNCSCNYAASTNTSCRTQCEPVFAACSPVIPSAIEAATSPLDVPTDKSDALEQAFVDMLRSDGSSDAAIAAWLEWFRSLPDAAKRVYLESSTRK